LTKEAIELIYPDWPAPDNIRAVSTTRPGGQSASPFDTLNLGDHVGDRPDVVEANRSAFAQVVNLLSNQIQWMKQMHGNDVHRLDQVTADVVADAAVTQATGVACAIMTADCLPVLFASRDGNQVAAAHAGWRGLSDGVLEKTLAHFDQPNIVIAWLGPAIGPTAFEVGEDVLLAFGAKDSAMLTAFSEVSDKPGKYWADLYQLARMTLNQAGVHQVYGGERCTFSEADQFFSFRRDGVTGRMATLIWKAV